MPSKIERLDKYLLGFVTFTILAVVTINFITSYGHIYAEGLRYGEYGIDARLMPVGIDGMLAAIGLANVFAARYERNHWLLRSALAFGVAGTVAVNGAYGAGWGITGGLLATWSPVALFISVEAGLFMFRIAADIMRTEVPEVTPEPVTPRRVRNRRPKPTPTPEPEPTPVPTPEKPAKPPTRLGEQLALPPVIKGTVKPVDPLLGV